MKIKDEIWVLADDRPGTALQGVGLAEEIGFEYKTIKLEYGFFATLPNWFFSRSLIRLSKKSRKFFENMDYLPTIVISAGRRLAPVSLFLKKQSQNRTKIIQIMNPNLDLEKFDFVILPKHDEVDESKFSNLITTIGSLTKTNEHLIAIEKEKFSPWFQNIEKTKIALLVGGSSKNTNFSKSLASKLAKNISLVANNMNATLLVLTSRRTGDELSNVLKENLTCDFKFFDWPKIIKENPYLAILGWADFFVITGDSVSMISECCSMGKPVYIFDDKDISTKKHRKFHHDLFAQNYAKKFIAGLKKLEKFSSKKLQETKRVSMMIRSNF